MPDVIVAEPLYEKLKKKLIEYIEKERPRLLPCEKDLINYYQVSRNTVRRAIQELTNEGILKPVQGLGTMVYPTPVITDNSMLLIICDAKLYPFQQEIFNKLMRTLDKYRFNAMLTVIDKDAPDEERLEYLIKKADGIIIDQLTSYSSKIHEIIKKYRRKCVCLRWIPSKFKENYVAEDISLGFYKITKHLIELGHKKIAFIGNVNDRLRWMGINRALDEYGLRISDKNKIHFINGTRNSGFNAANELLAQSSDFSAVMCHNDDAALGVMERFFIAGIEIPQDISITGFDNIEDSEFYPIPLTTSGASLETIINEAIAILVNKSKLEISEKLIAPNLILRKSTKSI